MMLNGASKWKLRRTFSKNRENVNIGQSHMGCTVFYLLNSTNLKLGSLQN